MLTITRFLGQEVVLRLPDGVEVLIAVTQISPGKVRIGIQAPRELTILRPDARCKQPRERKATP